MMIKLHKNKFVNAAAFVIFFAVILGSVYGIGYERGTKNPNVTIIKGVNNIDNGKEDGADFSLFWNAWNILKGKFVDSNKITNQDLVYGAISGLMSATKDPYTVFMPPTEADSFNQEISGEFGGIGAELGIKMGQLMIVAPLKNTPAEKAGIKAGDAILKINSTSTVGMSTDEAVKDIRGERGTKVTLNIIRDGWDKPQDFVITRDIIQIPTLDWKMINKDGKDDQNGGILYAQLYNFYEQSPSLFYQMIVQAIYRNPKGVIIDLRNNPGGYLEAATNIASWFLNNGDLVVGERFQSGSDQQYKSEGNGVFKNIPVVVLINEGSASASEILAGALRDDRGAKLVGVKSFGKGSVQELEQLPGNSQIKVTIAHWLTPSGLMIDKNGLTPDYTVNISDQDIKDGKDPQFAKAVEVLAGELK